jgi:hypothetical protein
MIYILIQGETGKYKILTELLVSPFPCHRTTRLAVLGAGLDFVFARLVHPDNC